MVARILNLSFELVRIIDDFHSFIWNEYYVGYGDFELSYPMDELALGYVREGFYVSIAESQKYMIIERIEIKTHVEEGNYVYIKGRSLESILCRRVIDRATTLTGNLQSNIMRLVQGFAEDIPQLAFKASTDKTVTSKTIELDIDAGENLYDIISSLCEMERIGFRVLPQENLTFQFELYGGVDHSYDQNEKPWVVFSAKFENLKYTNMAIDLTEYKTTCIVVAEWDTKEYTMTDNEITETTTHHSLREEVGSDVKGLDRREIFLESNIKPDEIEIDREAFGHAGDRVNKQDYMTWEPIYFDSAGYKEALENFNKRLDNKLSDRKMVDEWQPKVKDSFWNKGSDSIHKPKAASARAGLVDDKVPPDWLTNYAPKKVPESLDSWQHRNAAAFAWAERNEPNKADFMEWGWVLNDKEYQKALDAAQKEIDAEYNAAVQAALSNSYAVAKQKIINEAWMELAPYLVITDFEGEVDPNVQYLYNRDYFLGDVVQIVNEFGFQAKTRVTSIILSQEEGIGFKIVPNFESDDRSEVDL